MLQCYIPLKRHCEVNGVFAIANLTFFFHFFYCQVSLYVCRSCAIPCLFNNFFGFPFFW